MLCVRWGGGGGKRRTTCATVVTTAGKGEKHASVPLELLVPYEPERGVALDSNDPPSNSVDHKFPRHPGDK